MSLMVIHGVLLHYGKEAREGAPKRRLKAMPYVTATVIRAGLEQDLALRLLEPSDVLKLSAGDILIDKV